MAIQHHPEPEHLLAYAVGGQDEAPAVLVASHLALCPLCRETVARMEAVGGAFLEALPATPMTRHETVVSGLDALPPPEDRAAPASASLSAPVADLIPRPLRDYLPADLDTAPWRRLTKGAAYIDLAVGGRARARLLKVMPGTALPYHGHSGDEVTMVFAGGYSDVTGTYGRGDVACADPAIAHQPIADAGEPCVCLLVSRGILLPSRLLAPLARLFRRLTA